MTDKTIMKNINLLILLLLFTLGACGKAGKSPVKLKVTVAGIIATGQPLMFFAKNLSTNQKISRPINSRVETTIEIPNGTWQFSMITWTSAVGPFSGTARCFTQDYLLDSSPVSVNANLLRTNCSHEIFGGDTSYLAASGFKMMSFNNCSSLGHVDAEDDLCNSTFRGFARSIRIGLMSFDETKSSLRTIGLESNCINLNIAPDGRTDTNLSLPASSGEGIFQYSIKAYANLGCAGHMSSHTITGEDLGMELLFLPGSTNTQLYTVTPGSATIPTISYDNAAGSLSEPMTIHPKTLLTNGATITNCNISPGLPAGLSFDSLTCVITGTPTVPSNQNYTITATNSVGPRQTTLSLATINCPSNYVAVASNANLGINRFCVAKFEMKDAGSSSATSQPNAVPWTSITPGEAKAECIALGAGNDLISVREWTAIAREIEKTSINWESGVVGTGTLYNGHSDNSPNSPLPVTTLANPYTDTGSASGLQKRTNVLNNGQIIWDFAGNVNEWVDYVPMGQTPTSTFRPAPTSCSSTWVDIWPDAQCIGIFPAEYGPMNPASKASYGFANGLGKFLGGAGRHAARGGMFNDGWNSGVFMLSLSAYANTSNNQHGFRCVYRP